LSVYSQTHLNKVARPLAITIGLVVFVISLIYDFLSTHTLAEFVFTHSSIGSGDNYPTVAGWRFLSRIFEYGYGRGSMNHATMTAVATFATAEMTMHHDKGVIFMGST
jgi:hypothetical protein